MADNGRLIIEVDGDTRALERALGRLDDVGADVFGALAAGVAALSAGFVAASSSSLKLASDLQEVQNVVDVTFGQGAKDIQSFADAAGEAFGLSELQAKKYSSTLGAMMKSMGLTSDQVLDMSQRLTGLAGDFASFYNLDHEFAFEKIRSGLSGETEPLMQLGINMQVASLEAYALSKGIKTAFADMSIAEKTLLRYNYLLEKSADAQGDFARTADGYANQLRLVGMEVQTLGVAFGNVLLPVATKALDSMRGSVQELTKAFSGSELSAGIASLGESFANLGVGALEGFTESLPDVISTLDTLIKNLDFLTLAFVGLMAKSKLTSSVMATQALTFDRVKTAITGLTAEERRREVLRAAARSAQAQDLQAATRELVAVRNLAQARVQEAQAAVVSAQAQQQQAVTRRQVAAAVIAERNAVIQLSAAQASALVATNNLRNSQALLRTTIQSTAASMTLLSGITAGLRNVGSTLLAALGGPVGAAITALVLGLSYLATRESEADAAARKLAEAQNLVSKAFQDAKGKAGEYTEKLGEAARLSRDLAQEKAAEALATQWKVLSGEVQGAVNSQREWKETKDGVILQNEEEIAQLKVYADTLGALKQQLEAGEISSKEYEDAIALFIKQLEKGDKSAQNFGAKLREMFNDGFFSRAAQAYNALKKIVDLQTKTDFVGPPEPETTTPSGSTGGVIPPATGNTGKTDKARQLEEEAAAADRLNDAIKRVQLTDATYQQWQISKEVNELITKYPNLTAKVKEWEQAQLQALRGEIVENIRSVVEELGKLSQQEGTPDLKVKKDIDAAWAKLQQLKIDLRNVDTSLTQTGGILPTLDPELIRAMNAPTAKEAGAGFAEDMGTGIEDSWGTIGSGIGGALRQALEGEKSWGDAFADLGMNLIEGLVDGLWDTANSMLTDVLKNIGVYIVKAFSGFMGIASPSKVFADLGYWTMAGYAEGLTDSAKMAMKPLSDLKSSMSGAMSGVDMGSIKASLMPSATLAMAGAGGYSGGVNVSIINKSSANIEQTAASVSYDNQGNMDITATIADAAVGKITQTGSRQEKAISRKFGMKNQPTRR